MKNEVDFEGIIKVLLRWLKYIPSYPTFSARIVIKFWTRNYRSNLLNFREDFRFSGINIKKEEGERYTWKMNRLFANPNKAIRLRNDTLDYNSNKSLTFAGRMKWREGEGVAGAVSARQGRERRGWWVKLGGGREGGVGKRSLVKNTRVTRSFTRGATSVACWSRERERLLYGWALVSNWILRSRRKRGAGGIVARGLLPSRAAKRDDISHLLDASPLLRRSPRPTRVTSRGDLELSKSRNFSPVSFRFESIHLVIFLIFSNLSSFLRN